MSDNEQKVIEQYKEIINPDIPKKNKNLEKWPK